MFDRSIVDVRRVHRPRAQRIGSGPRAGLRRGAEQVIDGLRIDGIEQPTVGQLGEEAVETAAGIAVLGRESTVPSEAGSQSVRRTERFWAMYWGLMGMVENQEVTDAMVAFGKNLKSGEASADAAKALDIAHACRSEMARSWSSVWSR